MSNRRFAVQLASALADLGVEHACLSPGSRNTPLLAGFAAEERIRKWPILDERSAGFFAVGLARSTGRPVVLACTSGTAAAEYLPAIIEASQSDVPLLVLTADRPPELRGIGAPQTIDQVSLYGSAVRLFADALPPDELEDDRAAAETAIDLWAHATTEPAGPVHLNLPFREPLVGPAVSAPRDPVLQPEASEGPLADLAEIAARLSDRKGLIVAGREHDPDFPAACAALAAATGFPIIADPLSGLRFGRHDLSHVIAYGDQLAAAGLLNRYPPEVVLRFGPVPTSKPLQSWLGDHADTDQILIDRQSRDATRSARTLVEMPPATAALALAGEVTTSAPGSWLGAWRVADMATADVLDRELGMATFPNEPAVARIVAESIPTGSVLTVGSSMPVRDFDAFGGKSERAVRVFGNRGANGIDGVVSAALGSAAAGTQATALVGDVSMFHDLNALGTAAQLGLPLTVVVINNDGGGIFHFLDQHDPSILEPDLFEEYLAAPHGTDFVSLADAVGLETHRVDDSTMLREVLTRPPATPRLIQITTDRQENLTLHQRLSAQVFERIRSLPEG